MVKKYKIFTFMKETENKIEKGDNRDSAQIKTNPIKTVYGTLKSKPTNLITCGSKLTDNYYLT